jgi:hypothetical protein
MPDVVDPYGGYREIWSTDILNAASQSPPAGIVFDHPVVRQAPATNQIALQDKAHFEACGCVAIAIAAYACGLIDDPVAAAIDACRFIGDDTVAKFGTDTAQLVGYAEHRGWSVRVDNRPAGELHADWAAKGLVGVMALDTAYGTGDLWNTLHPQAQGRIGHWEVGGNVNATGDAMTDDQFTQLCGWGAFTQFVVHLGRPPETVPVWQARADRIKEIGFTNSMWELTGGEGRQSGGLLGKVAGLDARVIAVEQHLASITAAGGAAYDPTPVQAEVDRIVKELADLHAALAAGAAAVGGPP